MKALVSHGPNQPFSLENVADPIPGPGEAVAKILACGAGLTVQHVKAGRSPVPFPRILGHEISAEIVETNGDCGNIKVGMPVSVSVDSFPSGEFGYINGTLTKLGSDALKPDQESSAYRFPGTISLEQQKVLSGDQELNLQSGMGVSANIKLRSRPAISIITDLFTKQFEGVKTFR